MAGRVGRYRDRAACSAGSTCARRDNAGNAPDRADGSRREHRDLSARPYLVVLNEYANFATVIDTASDAVIGDFETGFYGEDLTFNKAGHAALRHRPLQG